jgi:ribosome-binding factor A
MYKKENHSLARINKDLTMVINTWLLQHTDIDSRIITMRISHLQTAKDLSCTKIHIFHEDKPEDLVTTLNKHAHPIHQFLFNNLKIRRVPKIKFMATIRQNPEQQILGLLDEIDDKHK